jgi:hypothetical protein
VPLKRLEYLFLLHAVALLTAMNVLPIIKDSLLTFRIVGASFMSFSPRCWLPAVLVLAFGCAQAPTPPVAQQQPVAPPQPANPGNQAAQQNGGFLGGMIQAVTGQQPGAVAPNAQPQTTPGGMPQGNSPATGDAAASMYGDTGGEQTLPSGTPDAPLRARKDDRFYTLSNPRIGTSRFGRSTLNVDYKTARKGEFSGGTLLIRGGDGNTLRVTLLGLFSDAETIEVEDRFGGGPFSKPLPKNAELYMIRNESRYGVQPMPAFKVSNSVIMGTMPNPQTTLARNWTAEEGRIFTSPFQSHLNPNSSPHLGKDTETAGDNKNGGAQRYVDASKPLIGLEYRAGEWEKEKCIGQVVAVYDTKQSPFPGLSRVTARSGYAVGGVNVQSKKFVDAIQVVFMKIKPSGGLDATDLYTSDWLGTVGDGKTTKLGQTGKIVMGINCKQGAILNGFALVMEP